MSKPDPNTGRLTVGLAQIAPVWLNRARTLEKIITHVQSAAESDCNLVVFGEALLPGYPFWLERTDGARFNSPMQKEIFAHYADQSVQIEAGHLDPLRDLAAQKQLAIVVGIVERAADRGGHSLYCSCVYIDDQGVICSVHRKLMPTYDERLVWAHGDGHGLKVHPLSRFTLGALNCWENWMPLARAALYGQGEDLHVAIWPGSRRNTHDITRFIARESRSYVISVSGLMNATDIPDGIPHVETIRSKSDDVMADGGSCLAAPDGEWVIEPIVGEERLVTAIIDHEQVRQERQNFDPAGHYARPDVTKLVVNRERQNTLKWDD
jgi:nitrilase